MKHYQELTLLPNEAEDLPLHFLWSKLYQQLHMAWVEAKDEQGKVCIGVSFPRYDYAQKELGCKLRLFAGTESAIQSMNLEKWLSRLTDYVHISSIRPVPESPIGYAVFKRQQTRSNIARIARRKAKYQGITLEEARDLIGEKSQVFSHAPYIKMDSQSSKRSFRLLITCEQVSHEKYESGFSTYGLSSVESQNTVPLF